jgi:hypothetical protein
MMEIATECATGSPDTEVGRTSTFQLMGSLTASAGEVNENITKKGVQQMQATLSGGNALDASAGGDAAGALSNMLFSAGLDAAVPIDDDVMDGNGTNITNATRRAVIGLNNDTIFANLSYANMTVGQGHGNFSVGNATCEEMGFGCEECSLSCGVTLANGDFESHGSCVMGDCVCNAYPCVGARCVKMYYEQDPDGCYTIDDHCFNNTCYRVDCEMGWCDEDEPDCVAGRCIPKSNDGGDGMLECFEGPCPFEEKPKLARLWKQRRRRNARRTRFSVRWIRSVAVSSADVSLAKKTFLSRLVTSRCSQLAKNLPIWRVQ